MKHSILKHHRREFDPKYNPHLGANYHSKLKTTGRILKWTFYVILSLIVIVGIVIGGILWMDRSANQHAKRSVDERVERDTKPKEPVYDQNSLSQHSDHRIDQEMIEHYARSDGFISKIKYDSKRDVANVYLTKSAARAINYVSKSKKAKPNQLSKLIKKGVKINDTLSNQAVMIANHAHDGYFTFRFANAKNYQAPNTKTGNYKE